MFDAIVHTQDAGRRSTALLGKSDEMNARHLSTTRNLDIDERGGTACREVRDYFID